MSRIAKASIEDDDLLDALDEAEERHGSMADALRHAIRETYADGVNETVANDGGLPKAAREGYAALREHANVGERLSLDAAESIIAQRVQLRKDTVRGSVIRKLHGAGWIAVEQGIHEVAIIVGDRAASDGGRDVGVLDDRGDDVDAAEVDSRLDELAEATVDRGDGIETDGGRESNPLNRIFVEDADERPDEVVVEELTTLDTEEFVARLESLAEAAEAVETMAQDLERLRKTGLSDGDARDLIYGRNNSLAKRDIEAMFEAVDDVAGGRADRPVVRLLAEVSGLTLSETSELMDELDRLNRKYGGDER